MAKNSVYAHRMRLSRSNDIWAITCYFNPVGYRTRLENYRTFWENLKAPLVTVELGYGGSLELTPNDATHLIQLHTDQVIWQKERLLNIALQALPDDCRFVAWLDCDVVFQRGDWLEAAVASLEHHVLIQPYSVVHDLKRGADVADVDRQSVLLERRSMIARYLNGSIDFDQTSTNMLAHYSPGHAWAIRREVVEISGLYDGMILGSGDFAMAMAAIERCDDIVDAYAMNQSQADHYRRWSAIWNHAINGRVGIIEGTLYHLWHGSLEDRGYDRRYTAVERFQFDPNTDIKKDENGCWRWNSNKPDLHQYVRRYFESRREDGP